MIYNNNMKLGHLETGVYFYTKKGEIHMINDRIYNILKYVAQIVLPAIGTLYFALAGIWGFPYGEEIVGTITAIDTFLGVLLGISTATYNKKCVSDNTSIQKYK